MLNLSTFKITKLIEVLRVKIRHDTNYLSLFEAEDDRDREYIAEKMAEIVFYQNLQTELENALK